MTEEEAAEALARGLVRMPQVLAIFEGVDPTETALHLMSMAAALMQNIPEPNRGALLRLCKLIIAEFDKPRERRWKNEHDPTRTL